MWPASSDGSSPDRRLPGERVQLDRFFLEMLAEHHNERDHDAWMSSIDHIRQTPGFASGDWGEDGWPVPMTVAANLGDLQMHAAEFAAAEAFAYSVLDDWSPAGAVIGCVYIDPDISGTADVQIRSWVRASHASSDEVLAAAVDRWIAELWPAARVRWPGRSLGSAQHPERKPQ